MTLRIEPIPKAENGEGDEGHERDLRRLASEPREELVVVLVKSPPREAGGGGQHQGERFVKQREADGDAEGQSREPGETGAVGRGGSGEQQ